MPLGPSLWFADWMALPRYADDSAAGSRLERLRRWWDLLVEVGPLYGYFSNGSKTHVLAKPNHNIIEAAKEIFKGTRVVISIEGERYLGGAVGNSSFVRQYVERKVEGWVNEVKKLSKVALKRMQLMLPTPMGYLQNRITY